MEKIFTGPRSKICFQFELRGVRVVKILFKENIGKGILSSDEEHFFRAMN